MRIVAFWVAVAFLLFLGLGGLQSAFSNWTAAETLGQRLCTVGEGAFGAFGLLAGGGAIGEWRWAGAAALAFAVSGGITAGLASVFWGGTGILTGLASAALGFLLGILFYWGVGARRRDDEGAEKT